MRLGEGVLNKRMRLRRRPTRVQAGLLCLLLGVALSPAHGLGQVPAPTEGLDARLLGVLEAFHAGGTFPGASAAVSLPGGAVISLTVGEADTARHIPMDPGARMFQGSVGKTYFAALAMRLRSEGRLDLDAPVSSYLGHYPWYSRMPNAGQITDKLLPALVFHRHFLSELYIYIYIYIYIYNLKL